MKRAFGDLEQSILNIMQAGNRMTVKQVQDKLDGNDKYTTVMTVMARLAEKNVLDRERVGGRFEYWLLQDSKTKQSLFQKLKKRLFGMKTIDMVSYLIDEADDMTVDDLKKVEQMIETAKKKRKK